MVWLLAATALIQDVRMENALRATGFTYNRPVNGTAFEIDFDHENAPRRRVFINATDTQVGTMTPHLVYSTVLNSRMAPDWPTLEKLITTTPKQGSYFVFRTEDGGYALRFGVQVDVSTFPDRMTEDSPAVVRLKDTIYFVNQVAQEASVAIKAPG